MGGTIVTWLENTWKLAHVVLAGMQEGDRRGRGSGLESDGEEHHGAFGVLDSDLQRVERRVHETHVGAACLGPQQVAVASRNPHHVAERREDDAGCLGDRDGVVDPSHGDHADRATGAVDELDGLRQHVLDAVAIDGMGVPTAHFHELEVIVAGEVGDPGDKATGSRRVAVLVDVLHLSTAPSAGGRR